jgi:hypothetical protein
MENRHYYRRKGVMVESTRVLSISSKAKKSRPAFDIAVTKESDRPDYH